MSFLEHLDELRKRIFRIAIAITVVTVVTLAFRTSEIEVSGSKIPFLLPMEGIGGANIASQLLKQVQKDVLPNGVEIIVTEAPQALISLIYVSIFLGLVLASPIIIKETMGFIGPALYQHEKKNVLKVMVPGTLLFVIGVFFAYFFVTPVTFDFLYRVAIAAGAKPYITIDNLIATVLVLSIGTGLAFQLPIIMWLLTASGIVEASLWRRNIRLAIVAIVIIGAVVTPDVSGVTMWLIAFPLILLYFIGMFVARKSELGRLKRKS